VSLNILIVVVDRVAYHARRLLAQQTADGVTLLVFVFLQLGLALALAKIRRQNGSNPDFHQFKIVIQFEKINSGWRRRGCSAAQR
jgi:hypothetical protein